MLGRPSSVGALATLQPQAPHTGTESWLLHSTMLHSVTVLQCYTVTQLAVTLNNAVTQRSIFTAPGSSWRQGGNQLPTEGYSWTENQ